MNLVEKREKRERRHQRLRTKIRGTSLKPRLSVFRSLGHICAQLIDDDKAKTLAMASDLDLKFDKKTAKTAKAAKVGELIAKKAREKKIINVVFDRGGFKYHGRVKALAQGARNGGLKF